MKTLSKILKEFQILNHLKINIIGKKIIHQKYVIVKCLKKITQQLLLIFCILKKNKYFQLIVQIINNPWKKKKFINDSKQIKRSVAKSAVHIIERNNMGNFIVWIIFILLEQKINLSLIKKHVKIKISGEL